MGEQDKASKSQESFTGNNENGNSDNSTQYERGEHPKSLANLTPFPKGVSGNPIGRPFKHEKLKRILNVYGDEDTFSYMDKPLGTRRNRVLEQIWQEAMNGDMRFVQLLANLGCLDEESKK
jgi:hypothetical protein